MELNWELLEAIKIDSLLNLRRKLILLLLKWIILTMIQRERLELHMVE
jgi:hypothetical protein